MFVCCSSGTFLVEYTERYVVCGIAESDPKAYAARWRHCDVKCCCRLFVTGGANRLRRLAIGCSKQSAWTGCSARPTAVHYALPSVWPAADRTADRSTTMLGAFAADLTCTLPRYVCPYVTCWMDVHEINRMLDSFIPTGTFHCRSEPTKTAMRCVPNSSCTEYGNTRQINTLLLYLEVSEDKPALQDCWLWVCFLTC